MQYYPDNFVLLKIMLPEETIYKVLGGWSGGYLDGDHWRMNSGIVDYSIEGNKITFKGDSGSEYIVHRENERVSGLTSCILADLLATYSESVQQISLKDFEKEFTLGYDKG